MTAADHADEMAEAHTDLTIFAAVQALMEHSLLSADSHLDEFRMVALSLQAQYRCLRRYEAARTALTNTSKSGGERE